MYTLVLLAGGSGSRMGKTVPKQYLLLAGKPIIMHTLERIEKVERISELVIVCETGYVDEIKKMLRQYQVSIPVKFAEAGITRQMSVKSGLELVTTKYVILHEAARPFVTENDFEELINVSEENAIYGVSIPFTVIRGHEKLEGILERSELLNVQLPQKFEKSILVSAHKKAEEEKKNFTEDASLVYYYNPNIEIKVCRGKDYNIKITTPMDLITGEVIYKEYFARRK